MPVLPPNVYRLPQRRFDAIPGAPWVYWVSDTLRDLFETLPKLGDVAEPRVGLQTADNFRFLRFWWEVGAGRIGFGCRSRAAAEAGGKRWFPYMKGGEYRKWYGNQEYVVNWFSDGAEIDAFKPAAVIRNPNYYFREGVTWSRTTSKGVSLRYMPAGFVFDVEAAAAFGTDVSELLAVLNSTVAGAFLALINPTIHYQIGDMAVLPFPRKSVSKAVVYSVIEAVAHSKINAMRDETTFDFVAPPSWETGLEEMAAAAARLAALERAIDDEVYRLYGIGDADRAAIEAELAGGADPHPSPLPGGEGGEAEEDDAPPSSPTRGGRKGAGGMEEGRGEEEAGEDAEGGAQQNAAVSVMSREALAARWLSYAVGVVLGRFQPGAPGALGRAVYRREDFAVGSLPAPDDAEFDALVGAAARFAYVDDGGGRHIFGADTEAALRGLAVPDGITVLDAGHPRDLAALAETALTLMLGEAGAAAVIAAAAGAAGLRAWLARDYFTAWHLKWYRKRPVYWPLQSARRGYGFVVFHERVERATLHVLQREYLDQKLNGLRLALADMAAERDAKAGRERRAVERRMEGAQALLDEVAEFANAMARVTGAGYEPAADWLDDGVLLRLAPLWELAPLWRGEPKKAWERLHGGDFDWSHIAMRYWPARVKAKCQTNKSFAIAHGHPEWYGGR